jgi:hypothetical protein
MEPSKTLNNVQNQVAKMKGPIIAFLKTHLDTYGNLIDQLRVMGYLGQAMVDMANTELVLLKMQDEAEDRAKVKVYQN